jgi:SAM-dependent methyltransferase
MVNWWITRTTFRSCDPGFAPGTSAWADLGSGTGAFTLALADLLDPAAVIHSVDSDKRALGTQHQEMSARFPDRKVSYIRADFTRHLGLPPLDGIVMANSLHFQRTKQPVLELVRTYLKPGGCLVLVEYDTDKPNMWVPHPISFGSFLSLAAGCGFTGTHMLAARPSRFLGRIYSAKAVSPS